MSDPGFTTLEMGAAFAPSSRVSALMRFEAALALAMADVGIVDEEAAGAVAEACAQPAADPDAVLAGTWTEGTPLIPLLAEIRGRLSESDARWAHFGATSQDAVDTAMMLQAAAGLEILEHRLTDLARLIAPMVDEYRDQPHVGRTFLQHARPTTFGVRLAGWLEPVLRHVAELRETRAALVVQLGGPVGDLAGYGDRGVEVMAALARRLDLKTPDLPWHTDRSRVSAMVSAIERPARTMAKIAVDVALLNQSEIAEIRVRGGGSSSMTEKRNPIGAIRAVAAAEACSAAAGIVTSGRPHELDRAVGGWHAEWLAIPLVFQTAAAAVEGVTRCLESLEVDRDRMSAQVKDRVTPDPALIEGVLSRFDEVIGTA